jgi:dsDNA-specific endonuclease/ATPase MutS2
MNISAGTLNTFQQNEKVGFLSEKGGGTVISVLGAHRYLIVDEDGFERIVSANELIKIHGTDYKIPENENIKVLEDGLLMKDTHVSVKEKSHTGARDQDLWEIDLHIEALIDSHRGMSNSEILDRQMRELRTFYQAALQKRIRKLVIIHGVGEGVLKQEVRDFLSCKTGISFYDADFRTYGKGATAVEVRYTQIER